LEIEESPQSRDFAAIAVVELLKRARPDCVLLPVILTGGDQETMGAVTAGFPSGI